MSDTIGDSMDLEPREPPDAKPPMCRARHLRTMLKQVSALPAADRAAIEAAVSTQARQAVLDASMLAWVDMCHNIEITRAIMLRLGPQRARAFMRSFLVAAYDTSLMRNFMQASLRISQRDVGLGLRLMPRGYDLIFRNVGSWAAPDIADRHAKLSLRSLPSMCMDGTLWLESVAGSLESVFDLGRRDGAVDIAEVDIAAGRVDFALRW